LTLLSVNAINPVRHHGEPAGGQIALDICPKLKVNCVLDGDWRHPVGSLGTKRESSVSIIGLLKALGLAFEGCSTDLLY